MHFYDSKFATCYRTLLYLNAQIYYQCGCCKKKMLNTSRRSSLLINWIICKLIVVYYRWVQHKIHNHIDVSIQTFLAIFYCCCCICCYYSCWIEFLQRLCQCVLEFEYFCYYWRESHLHCVLAVVLELCIIIVDWFNRF